MDKPIDVTNILELIKNGSKIEKYNIPHTIYVLEKKDEVGKQIAMFALSCNLKMNYNKSNINLFWSNYLKNRNFSNSKKKEIKQKYNDLLNELLRSDYVSNKKIKNHLIYPTYNEKSKSKAPLPLIRKKKWERRQEGDTEIYKNWKYIRLKERDQKHVYI